MSSPRTTCHTFLIRPGTVACIPLAHIELYVVLDSLVATLALPGYSTVMIRQLDRLTSDIVNEEGRAYAEALRQDSRYVKQGSALRNWLDGISESL